MHGTECKTAICDDEIQIGQLLQKKLLEYSMQHEVDYMISVYQSGRELLDAMDRDGPFDLIFLDVQMPVLNGLETAAELRKKYKDTVLIFLSSYKDYVFDSFKVQAFRYLLKPLKDEELQEVLDTLCRQWNREDRLNYSFQNEHYSVAYSDILYIEGMRGKIWIHCTGETCRWRGSLSVMAVDLQEKGFFLIHRSYLINMRRIVRYNSQEVEMENGQILPVSKLKYNDFRKEYIRIWGESLPFRL